MHNRRFSVVYTKIQRIQKLLDDYKYNFCGVGSAFTLYRMGFFHPDDWVVKKLIIATLKVEHNSLKAKITKNKKYYEYKELYLHDLIYLCEKYNINYGFSPSDNPRANSLVFFDFPFGQVSWHTMLDYKKFNRYYKKWDGMELSVFKKIEKYILDNNLL